MTTTYYATRNANQNTAAFGRWMDETSAPVVEVAPARKSSALFPVVVALIVGAVALALPVAQILGIL